MKRAPQTAVREALDELQRLRTRLHQLSDLLWQSIDPNDPRDLEEGVRVQQAYVNARNELDGAARNVEKVLAPLLRPGRSGPRAGPTRRLTLKDDFTYTRPVSYRLGDVEYPVSAWKEVYTGVLNALAERDEDMLKRLPAIRELSLSRRGDFSTDRSAHRYPVHIRYGVYAETNFSANDLRDRLRRLLPAFGVPEAAFSAQVHQQPREG